MVWERDDAAAFCEHTYPQLYGALLLYCGSREGAIVRVTDDSHTITFVAHITAIPAVTITVLAEPATTTVP